MSIDQPNVPAPRPPLATAPPAPANPLRGRLAPVALVVIVLVLWAIFMPRPNPSEQLATRVTQAIVKNDMRPVEKDFNAMRRDELENRAKVGLLSQDLNELGKLKRIKEDTPAGSRPRYHHFAAEFDKGTWEEDLTLDPEGKIASFHVHAPAVNLSR